MKPLPALRLAAVLALLLACTGCAARHDPAAYPVAPETGVQEMRAACKGWLWWDGRKHRFEAAYAVRPPDSLYAEFAGRIGGTQAILAVTGGRILVLIPGERRFLQEEATAETFEALFGLRLDAPAVVAILGSAGMNRGFTIDGDASRLAVRVEGDRLRVDPAGAAAGGFEGLELKFQEIDRPPESPIDDSLFDVTVPDSFVRIPLDLDAAGPLLLP